MCTALHKAMCVIMQNPKLQPKLPVGRGAENLSTQWPYKSECGLLWASAVGVYLLKEPEWAWCQAVVLWVNEGIWIWPSKWSDFQTVVKAGGGVEGLLLNASRGWTQLEGLGSHTMLWPYLGHLPSASGFKMPDVMESQSTFKMEPIEFIFLRLVWVLK